MSNQAPNVRRIIRANRLLAEQGHPGDSIAALSEMAQMRQDALRYRMLRRGQHWSVINGVGDELRAEELDAAIDANL